MVHFRILPTAAAVLAVFATTAFASAGPTPNDTGSVRPVAPVRHPSAVVARHPIAVVGTRPVTPVAVAPRPIARRIPQNVPDDVLLARINRINRENCAMVMREQPDIAPTILTGIIDQRRAGCMRQRFNPVPFNPGFRRDADDRHDADDRRFAAARNDDRRDDRQINRSRFDADDRRISAVRFDDRRTSAARFDDRRDDRQINRLRSESRETPARHFVTTARFQADRRFAVSRANRPMGRPRP
jgi:hypothetical protein